jgi:hypothetical protein
MKLSKNCILMKKDTLKFNQSYLKTTCRKIENNSIKREENVKRNITTLNSLG